MLFNYLLITLTLFPIPGVVRVIPASEPAVGLLERITMLV